LHGASVEAIGQANAYQSKSWAHIVAPTNRRPYGFDWEDWGRLDALEVLEIAQERLQTDPSRTYLTGHSMGGHGAWHLGVTYPDHWAAIGPSAGWISMWSYAGAPERSCHAGPCALLTKARNPSDTMGMAHNLKRNGVYVLHGDQDDNVPVDQARQMRAELGSFHPDFVYYERPGAGHWWGNACVDWPPMFSFFQRHQQPNPEEVRQVDFQTASPGVSSRCDWVTIALQQRFLEPSRVQFTYDPDQTTIEGKTENVKPMALDLEQLQPEGSVTVRIDDEVLTIGQPKQIWLSRTANGWQLIDEPDPAAKGPHRYGTFKDAFRHRVQFVYGTQGTEAETAWALAKARFDAETFGYRGNGSIDIIPDTEFDPTADPDRNVVLYGHAEMNAAWKSLLNDSPVLIERGRLKVGDHERLRDDLGCLFLRPRQESDRASVGVVAGTGLTGLRLTDSLPVFVSGVAYPDLTVIGPDALRQGSEAVEATGYFGPDWSIENGAIGWSEP